MSKFVKYGNGIWLVPINSVFLTTWLEEEKANAAFLSSIKGTKSRLLVQNKEAFMVLKDALTRGVGREVRKAEGRRGRKPEMFQKLLNQFNDFEKATQWIAKEWNSLDIPGNGRTNGQSVQPPQPAQAPQVVEVAATVA